MSEQIDFASLLEPVARHLLGEPNAALSSRTELRFGSRGSLSVMVFGDKRGTWFDHEASIGGGVLDLLQHKAGCANGAAVAWLREHNFIEGDDRRADDRRSRIVATYPYRDADGNLLFEVIRRDPKDFRQRRPDGNGQWLWNLHGVERVLYRLPELLKADPSCSVLVVEGEKDADRLIAERFIATCNPGGAGKWNDAYSQHLRGRDVVLLPDNDETGEKHIEQAARSLTGIAESVRVLRLPGLPPKGDVSDWLDAGNSPDDLDRLVAQAPAYEAPSDPEPEEAPEEQQAAADSALWIDDDTWTEADIPRRPWVAPGYALRGAVTLIAGPPSAMKSTLMLGWATALGLGREYGRFRPVAPAPAIVFNTEDDMTEQRRRLSAVLRQFDAVPADLRGKVIRTGPQRIGTLVTRTEGGKIAITPALERLERLIEDTGAAMLIADPLAELHTIEENDNTGIRAVVAEFRRIAVQHNIAVVLLHHTRKGAAVTPGDPDIARGASAIIGAVRIALTLTGMSEDDARAFGLPTDAPARSHYVRLDDAKSNYAPIREAAWFEKTPYEIDNGETVPAAVPWIPPAAKVASLDDLARLAAEIERGHPTGEPWSPKLSTEARSVRTLLEDHGFAGPDAQKAVMAKLATEQAVVVAKFKSKRSRNQVQGLRIGVKPAADWLDTD